MITLLLITLVAMTTQTSSHPSTSPFPPVLYDAGSDPNDDTVLIQDKNHSTTLLPRSSSPSSDSHLVVPDTVGQCLLVVGVPINLLSFAYFVTRKEKGPNEVMFICLTTVDTVICVYLIGAFASVRATEVYHYLYRIYDQVCFISTFVTCQMSVVRMVALTHPLFRINRRAILISLVLFICLQFLPFLTYPGYFYLDEFEYPFGWNLYYGIMATLIIFISIVASIITVLALRRSGRNSVTKNKRKATITIIILTVTFLVYNIPHDVMLILYLLGTWRGSWFRITEYDTLDKMNLFYTQIGMQLNSITNAIIYFIRISNMRDFVGEGVKYVLRCGGHRTRTHDTIGTETEKQVEAMELGGVLPPNTVTFMKL